MSEHEGRDDIPQRTAGCRVCGWETWDGQCDQCFKREGGRPNRYGYPAYACSYCGYHQRNTASWCAGGCGRDYNQMTRIVLDEFWSDILKGERIPPQATLELNDYAALLREVPKVYDHVTCGRISKPTTVADAVIGEFEEYVQRLCDEAVREHDEKTEPAECPVCGGSGQVVYQGPNSAGEYEPCPECCGTGEPEFEGEARRWGLSR